MHETGCKGQLAVNRAVRRLVVAGSLVTVAGVAVALLASPARAFLTRLGQGPPTAGWVLSELVVGSATCLTLLASALLALGGVATVYADPSAVGATGRMARLAPAGFRRLVLLACGSAIVLPGLTAPVIAVEPGRDHVPDFPDLSGLPLPDLPISARPRPAAGIGVVRVHTGDSLWSIAADLAGSRASPQHIATCVDELYELNLHTIGPDPDLIVPGTVLTTPGGTR